MGVLFENKKYNVVFLTSTQTSMEMFTEEKLNSADSTKTIWYHPHMMRREISQGDFIYFEEEGERIYGVIESFDEKSSTCTIQRYLENADEFLIDDEDDKINKMTTKKKRKFLVEKENITKVASFLEFNLFLDHTTQASLGMQNMYIASLNSLNPSAAHNCIPVCTHDGKDNFAATKFVAKKPIAEINSMIENMPILNLTFEQNCNPETHFYETQPNFELSTFCQTCHKLIKECTCGKNKKFTCSEINCDKTFSTRKKLKTHILLDHTKNFNPKKKRKLKDLDPRLENHYKNAKRKRLSPHSNLMSEHQIPLKTRTTTITPGIVEGTKNIFNW